MQPNILYPMSERFNQDPLNQKPDQRQEVQYGSLEQKRLSSIADRIKALAAEKRESMKKQKNKKEEAIVQQASQREVSMSQEGEAVTEIMKSFEKQRNQERAIECIELESQATEENNQQAESDESVSPTAAPNRKLKSRKPDPKHNQMTNPSIENEFLLQPKGYSYLFTGKFDKAAIESAIRSFQEKQRVLDLEIQKLKSHGRTKMSYRAKKPETEAQNGQKILQCPKQNPYQRQTEQNPDIMNEWLQRRRWELNRKTDLTVLSLDELVEEAHNRGIISTEMRFEYVGRSTEAKILEFISLFIEGKFDKWNYKSLKITLLDHRRLVENLVNLYPSSYCLGPPIALHYQIHDFLVNLYKLSAEDYSKLCIHIDSISGITFWQTQMIKIVQAKKRSIEEVYFSTNNGINSQKKGEVLLEEVRPNKKILNNPEPKKNMMKKSSKHKPSIQ